MGARRIQSELLWQDNVRLSLATIHKILAKTNAGPMKRPPRRDRCARYERPVPGERAQMDTCKTASGLYDQLADWQYYYNWQRPHDALKGKTPIQKAYEAENSTPLWEPLSARYNPAKERVQEGNYQVDLQLRKLKECP